MTRLERLAAELAEAIREEVRSELAAAAGGPPELLSVDQAAERASIGRTLLYRMIADGRCRSVRIGRRRLVPADALKELAEGRS